MFHIASEWNPKQRFLFLSQGSHGSEKALVTFDSHCSVDESSMLQLCPEGSRGKSPRQCWSSAWLKSKDAVLPWSCLMSILGHPFCPHRLSPLASVFGDAHSLMLHGAPIPQHPEPVLRTQSLVALKEMSGKAPAAVRLCPQVLNVVCCED